MLSLFISFTSVERDLSINIYNVECKVGEIGSKTDQKLVKKGFFLGIYANDHLSMYLYEFKDFLENVFLRVSLLVMCIRDFTEDLSDDRVSRTVI